MNLDPLEAWHDFFLLAGTAGVTLLGLLFVALSLNTGIIMRGSQRHLRVLAMSAFEALLFTAILAFLALTPIASVRQHALMLVAFAVVWLVRGLGHLRRLGSSGASVRRHVLLPTVAYAVVVAAGIALIVRSDSVGMLLLMAVVWLVATATRSAWTLLVDVGEVRVEEAGERRGSDVARSRPEG